MLFKKDKNDINMIILGWLADRTGDYTLAFSVLGGIGLASSAMAVIIYLMIREDKRKQSKSSAEPADIDTRL